MLEHFLSAGTSKQRKWLLVSGNRFPQLTDESGGGEIYLQSLWAAHFLAFGGA